MEVMVEDTSTSYSLHGNRDHPLIPNEATHVLVEYDSQGKPVKVFYSKRYEDREFKISREEYMRRIEEGEALNERRLSPEEVAKVASLLEELADSQ